MSLHYLARPAPDAWVQDTRDEYARLFEEHCNTCPPDAGHNRPDHCSCGQRISINARDHAQGCNYEWQNGQPLVETYATVAA